ncbi:Thioredoxin Y1 isoform 1 [Hibiscus syriacus]|uniref:Thioredoxin Y1 isoform 1 n=1 Tax=Hibiscus syriacus TaxID=106335 RepID=A0A6A3BX04_HIBSY|nr:Thioredoxin Y1 isoform 1 [Hibiscus syriacus]
MRIFATLTKPPLPDTGQWLLLALNEKLPEAVVEILRAHIIGLHHYLMLFIMLAFSVLFDYLKAPGLGLARPWCASSRYGIIPRHPHRWTQKYYVPYAADTDSIRQVIERDIAYVDTSNYTVDYRPDWGSMSFLIDFLRPTTSEGSLWKLTGGYSSALIWLLVVYSAQLKLTKLRKIQGRLLHAAKDSDLQYPPANNQPRWISTPNGELFYTDAGATLFYPISEGFASGRINEDEAKSLTHDEKRSHGIRFSCKGKSGGVDVEVMYPSYSQLWMMVSANPSPRRKYWLLSRILIPKSRMHTVNWSIVGEYLIDLCPLLTFEWPHWYLLLINKTILILIPKVEDSKHMKQIRPISLCCGIQGSSKGPDYPT